MRRYFTKAVQKLSYSVLTVQLQNGDLEHRLQWLVQFCGTAAQYSLHTATAGLQTQDHVTTTNQFLKNISPTQVNLLFASWMSI